MSVKGGIIAGLNEGGTIGGRPAKDSGHKFLVEGIPRWMKKEAFCDYTAISLLSQGFDHFPIKRGVHADKLRILLFKGSSRTKFPPCCFEGMANLEVLSLKSIVVDKELSDTIRTLTKLRTLDFDECELVDIKAIGLLVDLLILSLRRSSLEELPNEIGELRNLILLDLSGTKCKVSADIIHRLSELEGLYMFDSIMMHPILEKKSIDEVGTHVGEAIVEADFDKVGTSDEAKRSTEFNSLPYMNALEMCIPTPEELPTDAQFVSNLDNFSLRVGDWGSILDRHKFNFDRLLSICVSDDIRGVLAKSCLKALVERADWLCLRLPNLEHLVSALDEQGFKELRYLEVHNCQDVRFKFIDDGLIAFPKLESLQLIRLPNLEMVCDWRAPFTTFVNLRHIYLSDSGSLQYVMPLDLISCNTTGISVVYCDSLKYIFIENSNDETNVYKLPSLKFLMLDDLASLIGFLGSETPSGIASQDQILFNDKIACPSLEVLILRDCRKVVMIWSKELGFSGFRFLREISLNRCEQLSSVGPPNAFAALEQLEHLEIQNCKNMVEVIADEECKIPDQNIIRFPRLKFLILFNLSKLERFCGESYKLEFPILIELHMANLDLFSNFTGLENSPELFHHEKVTFPAVENFNFCYNSNKIVKICCEELGLSGFLHLRQIDISGYHQFSSVGPPSAFTALTQLKFLTINNCKKMVEVITDEESEVLDQRTITFPKLESLSLLELDDLVKFCADRYKLEFPMLRYLYMSKLDSMNSFTGLKNSSGLFDETLY